MILNCFHKFCKFCITQKVTKSNEVECPKCSEKINKRSIPKETNKLFELCEKQYTKLQEFINHDSKINGMQIKLSLFYILKKILKKININNYFRNAKSST